MLTTNDALRLVDRLAKGVVGPSLEGEMPTITIGISVPEREVIVNALLLFIATATEDAKRKRDKGSP